MSEIYTDILIYLTDHDVYPKNFNTDSTDYEKELYMKFISLLRFYNETDDYLYQIERMIMVMAELGFLNEKRYQQYEIITKLTNEYYLDDERYFFTMLFEAVRNNSLSDESEDFLYDHFGDLMKKVLSDISIRDFQILKNEDIQSQIILRLKESIG